MRFKAFLFISLMSSFSVAVWGAPKPKTVEVAMAKPQIIEKRIKLIGVISKSKEAYLGAEISGIVEHIYVKDGAHVEKGTLLLKIKNPELQRIYDLARSKANLAEKHYLQSKRLFGSEDISKRTLDTAHADWMSAETTELSAKENLKKASIFAPFRGVVGVFKVKKGAKVSMGDEVIYLSGGDSLSLRVDVPADLLPYLELGQEIDVMMQKAQIAAIERALDPYTMMGALRAELGPCKNCIPGASVDVALVAKGPKTGLAIPIEAIFLKDKVPSVYVIKGDKAVLVAIKTGLMGDKLAEIIEGLKEGDQVVLRGQSRLHDQALVKIAK